MLDDKIRIMKAKILNYRVLVEKGKQAKKVIYVAYAPSLGISDFGETIEKAVENLKKAVKLYLETLLELKKPIPSPDADDYFVTTGKVELKLPSDRVVFC